MNGEPGEAGRRVRGTVTYFGGPADGLVREMWLPSILGWVQVPQLTVFTQRPPDQAGPQRHVYRLQVTDRSGDVQLSARYVGDCAD